MNPERTAHPRAPRHTALLAGALMLLAGAAATRLAAVGSTRYVDDNTCPSTGAGTLASPFCRIQDAICIAVADDTVSVAPGSYAEAVRMKPGVSLVSQGGPAVTTINALGQPCTDNDWCSKRAGSQCSVVTFASGHTLATRLEGFTLTGGAGLIQSNRVAGGGIYVFSSPTIVNNVITSNVLSGPAPQGEDLRGAGVYIATGSPVISSNTITGNRAIPPAGTNSSLTYGYGGGVWIGFSSSPSLTSNVIADNVAGNHALAYSLGAGGGVVVWPGSGPLGPLVDRNLVTDNLADSLGGGISLLSLAGTAAEAVVTNNVVAGNNSTYGGGVYTYFVKTRIANNTIVDNTAFIGGGLFTGQSETTLPVTITNNIIVGNHIQMFGNGGGLYTFDLDQFFSPTIQDNDLFGNQSSQCAGDLTDTSCFGATGNFSADPLFVNASARDFHLAPGSPAIDRAQSATAPPVDRENRGRGVDGNGNPNNPRPGDIDVGAYEFTPGCLPQAEVCDGLDNDCDLVADDGFPNADGDALADCVDPDDDNDLTPDAGDCAPVDPSAWASPVEVAGVDGTGISPLLVSFSPESSGTGTRYEVLGGLSSRLRGTGGFGETFCLSAAVSGSPYADGRPAPPAADAWFYLVRSINACGTGTLGSALRDAAGSGDACAAGIADQDADGSPSDLDCSDSDPSRAPILPELCDGVDNDCDSSADDGNPGGGVACGTSAVGECRLGTTLCTGGGLVCSGAVAPAPELCDGLDNDCDGTADNNVIDTDGDLMDDCQDADDDNDLVLDGSDCAPRDATAFGTPLEVQGLEATGSASTSLTWITASLGSGTRYDLVSGELQSTGISIPFNAAGCLGAVVAPPAVDGRPAPMLERAWYYLVKSRNACGPGTYGSPERDLAPTCP